MSRAIRLFRNLTPHCFAGLLALLLLAGCASDAYLDDPALLDAENAPVKTRKKVQPLLWTGEGPAEGHVIDPSKFNGDTEFIGQTRVDYIGALNSDNSYRGSPAERAELQLIRELGGGADQDLQGRLTINFQDDTLDYVVRQMLGGFLGINYILLEELAGTASFSTEVPITRSQVLPIVRSILAQHGYLMKMVNGVLHIGQAGRIASTEQLVQAGRQGDLVTRFLPVRGAINESLVQTLSAIVPAGIAIAIAPDGKSLLVRATPDEVREVEALVASLAQSGAAQNLFAIVYLHHSSPEAMAARLAGFFASQTMRGADKPQSIIPLDGRQALLVSASSRAAIDNVRRMASQLDFRLDDEATLRIIPLKHVDATTMAEQLSSVFVNDQPVVTTSEPTPAAAQDAVDASHAGMAGEAGADERVADAFDEPAVTTISVDSSAPSIIPDTRNNTLLVRSSYRVYKRIRETVQLLDVPLGQVVIEATILEVKVTDALKYGVQWYLSGNGFTVRNSPGAGVGDSGLTGFVASVEQLASGVTVNAVIDALDDVTEVSVVSSPYLTVLDRKTARLVVGDQIPFATKSQTTSSSDDNMVNVTNEIVTRDTGVVLEVLPVIRGDNSIELRIQQEISTPVLTSGAPNLTPTVTTRQITSDVLVYSGRTVLLGGLIQDRTDANTTGVPILRDAPFLGKLFEQNSRSDARTEVIVLITPRVSRQAGEVEQITDLLRNHMKIGASPNHPKPRKKPAEEEWEEWEE